ncbi:MAG: hypothetical protein ACRBBN_14340 [Methyloligellaceae bacterium]
MLIHYLISVAIGLAGAIIIVALWVSLELVILRYRCSKAIETVIMALKSEGKAKLLPWNSTKHFLDDVEPIQRKIQSLKQIVSMDDFKIELMKFSEHTLKVVIGFKVLHQGGNSIAQAIVHKTPSRVLVQQLIIE